MPQLGMYPVQGAAQLRRLRWTRFAARRRNTASRSARFVSISSKVIARSRAAAEKLSKGVLYLLKKNKIDYFEADAVVTGPHSVALAQVEGKSAPAASALEGGANSDCGRVRRTTVPGNEGRRRRRHQQGGAGARHDARERRRDRGRRNRTRVRLFLQRVRRQGDDRRAGKADAPRLRRGSRRGAAPRVRQARGQRDARAWLQVDGAQGRRCGRSR